MHLLTCVTTHKYNVGKTTSGKTQQSGRPEYIKKKKLDSTSGFAYGTLGHNFSTMTINNQVQSNK